MPLGTAGPVRLTLAARLSFCPSTTGLEAASTFTTLVAAAGAGGGAIVRMSKVAAGMTPAREIRKFIPRFILASRLFSALRAIRTGHPDTAPYL